MCVCFKVDYIYGRKLLNVREIVYINITFVESFHYSKRQNLTAIKKKNFKIVPDLSSHYILNKEIISSACVVCSC